MQLLLLSGSFRLRFFDFGRRLMLTCDSMLCGLSSEHAELLKLRAVMLQPRSADALEWQMRWEEVSVRCVDCCRNHFVFLCGGEGIPGVSMLLTHVGQQHD